MKKFVAAFDGLRFSESTLTYSLQLAKKEKAKLYGLFLEDPYLHGYDMEDLLKKTGGSLSSRKRELDRIDAKTRAISISRFEQACKKADVACTIRKQHRLALDELLAECLYADLLVISSHEALRPHRQKEPVEFIHSLLPKVHCPVLVVPANAKGITKNIILYDGKLSSIQALKSFCQTIGSASSEQTELVSVYSTRDKAHLAGGVLVKEYMQMHFEKYKVVSLEGVAAPVLVKYLGKEEGGSLIVMGAYKRNRISRWLKPSLADKIMSELELPVFISHM